MTENIAKRLEFVLLKKLLDATFRFRPFNQLEISLFLHSYLPASPSILSPSAWPFSVPRHSWLRLSRQSPAVLSLCPIWMISRRWRQRLKIGDWKNIYQEWLFRNSCIKLFFFQNRNIFQLNFNSRASFSAGINSSSEICIPSNNYAQTVCSWLYGRLTCSRIDRCRHSLLCLLVLVFMRNVGSCRNELCLWLCLERLDESGKRGLGWWLRRGARLHWRGIAAKYLQ